MKARDPFYDIVKALAILLVVLGHCQGESVLPFSCRLENFIIGCNMPLFFLLSGYFCWKTIETGDCGRLTRHVRSYIQPEIWIAMAFAFLSPLFGLAGWNPVQLAIKGAKWFVFAPWFIWALADCYALAFLIGRLAKVKVEGQGEQRKDKIHCSPSPFPLTFLLLAWVGLLFMPGCMGIVYKSYVRDMFPYFVIGGAMWHYGWKPWESKLIGGGGALGIRRVCGPLTCAL